MKDSASIGLRRERQTNRSGINPACPHRARMDLNAWKKSETCSDAGKRASRFGGALLALDLKAFVNAVFAFLAIGAGRATRCARARCLKHWITRRDDARSVFHKVARVDKTEFLFSRGG